MPPVKLNQKLFPVCQLMFPEHYFRNPTASFNQYNAQLLSRKANKCPSIIKVIKNPFKIIEDTIKKLAIV